MMEFIQNFHFLRPWYLLFLLIPVGFYFKKIGIRNYASSWENICDKNLLKFLLVSDGNRKRLSLKKYIYTGLVSMVIAAAGPAWKKVEIPTFIIENPSMFVLSLAQDMSLTDVSPSRLDRAKFMISDIADTLPEGQFGLEVYSQEPYIITPLTDDIKIIKSLLPQITPDIVPDRGDRLDRAIDLALNRFKAAGYTYGNIILFASDIGQQFETALAKIEEAAKLNYNINIVDTSFTGNEKLKILAEKGNGVYLGVKDPNLHKITNKIKEKHDEKVALSQNMRSNFLDYGYYLVFVALICLMPFFRRGLLILALCSLFSFEAQAGFLLNDNQEALKLFNNKQYDLAFDKFKDGLWRGISLYKQDKHEEALKEFSKVKSDAAFYNMGVILTKMCQYEDALKAFNEALKLNPNNEDAQYNKKVLDDLFEKAKEDPSVLKCEDENQQNQQQQNQNNDQNQNQDQNQENNEQNNDENNNSENDNSDNGNSEDNQDNNSENQNDENQSSDQQDENNSDDKNDQNQNGSQDNSENPNQEQNSDENDNQKDQNQENNEQNQQQNDDSSKQNDSNKQQDNSKQEQPNDSTPSDEDAQDNNGQAENNNTPAEANQDTGDEQKSKNEKGNANNATEMQEEEVESNLVNLKKGDENTHYDEEAMAMQRQYREIPEDTGGLLREFIKKEYMKERYHD